MRRRTTLTERGVLRLCTTGDYRPFSHLTPATKSYSGIDIDMARNLATSLGVKPRFVATTWARPRSSAARTRASTSP